MPSDLPRLGKPTSVQASSNCPEIKINPCRRRRRRWSERMPEVGGGVLSYEEELAAQSRVYRDATAHIASLSLKCVIDLGVFDTLSADVRGSMTLSELISKLPASIPPSKAEFAGQVLRLVAQMGYLNMLRPRGDDDDGGELGVTYSLTPLSLVLLKHKLDIFVQGGMNPCFVRPIQSMGEWLKSDRPECPFEFVNGKYPFALMKDDPEFNSLFNRISASDTQLEMSKVVAQHKDVFKGLRSLVDVGGNTGVAARAIAQAFPDIKCTIYDLPHVIATVPESPLVDTVEGDMFERVPRADAIFLKHILHDWNDADCVRILKRCKEAIPADGGKVIICEIVMPDDNREDCTDLTTQLCLNMGLWACSYGKERREQVWKKIFKEAGFTNYKFNPTVGSLRSVIELFP